MHFATFKMTDCDC